MGDLDSGTIMIEGIKHWWRLGRLHRDQRRVAAAYSAELVTARKAGATSDKIENIKGAANFENSTIADQIARELTWRLLAQANKLLVPHPDYNDDDLWEKRPMDGYGHLSIKGLSQLKRAIQEQEQRDAEIWRTRITTIGGLVGALTGAIGALIGLVALLRGVGSVP